jgi:hypothetical protein
MIIHILYKKIRVIFVSSIGRCFLNSTLFRDFFYFFRFPQTPYITPPWCPPIKSLCSFWISSSSMAHSSGNFSMSSSSFVHSRRSFFLRSSLSSGEPTLVMLTTGLGTRIDRALEAPPRRRLRRFGGGLLALGS